MIDPAGRWWGLRSSADGKGPGFPVVVFGGNHADVALSASHGEALAEIIGTTNTPAILDTRLMGVGERTRFFTDFAETLLRKNKGPLTLIIDEAHLFAPQGRVADPQSGKMLHAANNLVSLGRGIGLRIILISQRPAKLHKDSLTQVETMIALRLIAPQDRRAVEDWIGEWADPKEGRELLASLPSLPTGTGWIWAPELNVLKKATFPKIKTYDSGRAPRDGEDEAPILAKIDLPSIQAKLGQVAEDAKANDPKALRAEIARLKADAAKAGKTAPNPKAIEQAEARGYQRGKIEGYGGAIQQIGALVGTARQMAVNAQALIKELENAASRKAPQSTPRHIPASVAQSVEHRASNARVAGSSPAGRSNDLGEKMQKAERLILTALAQYDGGRTKAQIAVLTGYAAKGGAFNNALGKLRTNGWIEGRGGESMQITPTGLTALGPYEPLPHGDALLQHWLSSLGKAEREALTALAGAYPDSLTKEQVADQTGYAQKGGSFNNALGRLRTLGLVSGSRELRASENLFG